MSTANRIFVEISPHSVQLAVIADRRLIASGDYSFDDKEALAAFLTKHEVKQVAVALVSPRQPFARLAGEQAVSVRSEDGLLACAQTMTSGLSAPVSAVVCDAATGKPIDPAGQEPWLMAGTTAESLTVARDQMIALGLPVPALTALALPAQLGSVVAALQDMSESTRVAVLALGENDSVLGLVSAAGVEAVRPVSLGFTQIYEAVQLGLGLKFRAAAPKLFFNAAYDFADAEEKIAGHLAIPLQAALSEFTERPGILHVVGLPEKQAWLSKAVGQALNLTLWAPDAAKICSQLEIAISEGVAPTSNTLRLIQLGATTDATQAAWLPYALGDRPKPAAVVTPPPAPVVPPAPAVASASTIPPTPTAKPVMPPPAKAAAPAKPAAAPIKPVIKPAAPVQARPVAKPVQATAAAPAPVAAPVKAPEAKPAPVVHGSPLPVVAEAAHAAPAAPVVHTSSGKRSWGVYGVMALVLVVLVAVSVKFYHDGQVRAKELSDRQAADNARAQAEQVRKAAVEKAEASLKVDPVTGLPGSWISANIGAGVTPGSVAFKQGEFRLTGYGRDIGVFKDGFLFTYLPLSGDWVITARVITLSGANRVAKVGLMVRSSLDEGSAHVSLLLQNEGKDLKVASRDKAGAKTISVDSSGDMVMSVPLWLRLVRAGDAITAYQSDNGRAWRLVAGTPLAVDMPGKIYVGLAACSREAQPVMATFDHISVPGWESAPLILGGDQ